MGNLLNLEQQDHRLSTTQPPAGKAAAVVTLLASLNSRIPPLDVPAAFSVLPLLEVAASQQLDLEPEEVAPLNHVAPIHHVLDHVKKPPSERQRIEALSKERKQWRHTHTIRELKQFESRAAAQSDGTGGEDPAALAAMMILRLFDADRDGKISRQELVSGGSGGSYDAGSE